VGRLPRYALVEEGSYNHCTWRSHDHAFTLEDPEAKQKFLGLVAHYKALYGIRVLSYCVMGNHPHLVLVSDRGQEAFSAFWKLVNQRFARWYNRRHGRRGQVVMERLRSPLIQDDRHLLTVMRYVDLNPVRACICRSPKDFPWSSYRHYAFGEPNSLVDDAPTYLALGRNGPERRKAYVHLFALRYSAQLRVRRHDLTCGPFIGDEDWMQMKLQAWRWPPAEPAG
jgi:putative transposase